MKKTFRIINTVAVILTICVVSFSFLTKFSSGSKIYKQVYNFSNCTEMAVLSADISKASADTKKVNNSILTTEQEEYLDILQTSIEKVSTYFTFFSVNLSQDTSKSNKVNKISKQIYNLEEERTSLLLDVDEYLIKLSGNTYGNLETSVDYLLDKTVIFLSNYSSIAIKLNNLVRYTEPRITEYNLINLHLQAIVNLKENYQEVNFSNQAIEVVEDLNTRLTLVKQNFQLNKQGIYSPIATAFNQNMENCDIKDLLKNYSDYLNSTINPSTEKSVTKLTFYYFDKLTEVV